MPGIWHSLKTRLLDEGGIEAIFFSPQNLLVATVIIAAGSYATRQQPGVEMLGVLNLEIAGYGMEAIGFILVGLNLLDGLFKLARLGPPGPENCLVGMYLLASVRLIQFTALLRAG